MESASHHLPSDTRKLRTWDFALWAPLAGEMEESASHHLFALRSCAPKRLKVIPTGSEKRSDSQKNKILGTLKLNIFHLVRTLLT